MKIFILANKCLFAFVSLIIISCIPHRMNAQVSYASLESNTSLTQSFKKISKATEPLDPIRNGRGQFGIGTGVGMSLGKKVSDVSSIFGAYSPIYLDFRWEIPKAGVLQLKVGGISHGEKNGQSVFIGGFYGVYLRPLAESKSKEIKLYAAAGLSATALALTSDRDRTLKTGVTAGLSLTIEALHFMGQTGFIDISPRLSYQHRVLTLEVPIGFLFLF